MEGRKSITNSILAGLIISASFLLLLNLQACGRTEKVHKYSTAIAAKATAPNHAPPQEEVRAVRHHAYIPSQVYVHVGQEILCLFILSYCIHVEHPAYEPEITFPLSKHFLTLFRAVISPNAP
jgi:hypothetical protein